MLTTQLNPDWIAQYFLVGHGDRLAISEVRVLPRPRNGAEERRLADATKHPARVRVTARRANLHVDDEPPHLPAGALRNLLAEEAITVARRELPLLKTRLAGIDQRALNASVRRIKRKPAASEYEIAVVAAHYVDVIRAGGRGNEDVAGRLADYDALRVRRAISRARDLGFLPPTRQGRQANRSVTLTAKARRVLADGPPPGYAGPTLEARAARAS